MGGWLAARIVWLVLTWCWVDTGELSPYAFGLCGYSTVFGETLAEVYCARNYDRL